MFIGTDAQVTAEDLGLIPDFVRASLARLQVPGYKVLRWERDWHRAGQPMLDPATFPAVSVATTSTHDIEPLAVWWGMLEERERTALLGSLDLPRLPDVGFGPDVRDALLTQAYGSGSDLLLLPIQDVFGWADRVNTPATVGEQNWTWKLPLGVEALSTDADALERADALRALAISTGRIDTTKVTMSRLGSGGFQHRDPDARQMHKGSLEQSRKYLRASPCRSVCT